MDYKEVYEKALERARGLCNITTSLPLWEYMESIFPELAESEDERMKNFISNELACLRATDEKGTVRYNELTEAIAWLEKQGEQKITKIEVNTEELSDFERSLKHIMEEAIEDGDTHNLKADADMLLRLAHNHACTWSEEDERILNDILSNIAFAEKHRKTGSVDMQIEQVNWLKSIKDKLIQSK